MIPQRVFPTEDAVTAEIERRRMPLSSTAAYDQHIAAAYDTVNQLQAAADKAQVSGVRMQVSSMSNISLDRALAIERNAMRLYMAADSVGITALCSHTRMLKPQVISCTPPPYISCLDCANVAVAVSVTPVQCDCCGKTSSELFGYKVTLAQFILEGDICKECSRRTK